MADDEAPRLRIDMLEPTTGRREIRISHGAVELILRPDMAGMIGVSLIQHAALAVERDVREGKLVIPPIIVSGH